MRKSQITRIPESAPSRDQAWMDLDHIASVEVSSEDSDYPIESALLQEGKRGWRAAKPGAQTIRLIFDEPQKLKRILLVFEDTENQPDTRICPSVVARYPVSFSRNCSPAMEF